MLPEVETPLSSRGLFVEWRSAVAAVEGSKALSEADTLLLSLGLSVRRRFAERRDSVITMSLVCSIFCCIDIPAL